MKLPQAFLEKMQDLLGGEFAAFLQSYELPRAAGLRANSLKVTAAKLRALLPFAVEPVPWCPDGFYYDDAAVRPAKHPYFYAGLYYIQEPSAMLPAQMLTPQPGERVLDLCAAPGGKSVQLAGQLARQGLLVANDIHPQRAKALLKNLERCGAVNAVVCNETPDRLARVFAGFFDKILVDAPCSGEGMFRKDPDMVRTWSEQAVAKYTAWQADILRHVPAMLRPGGTVVYSTCTFSPEENEKQLGRFLAGHPDFALEGSERLWPHKVRGEGHFAAKLVHRQTSGDEPVPASPRRPPLAPAVRQALADFARQVWGQADAWEAWLPEGGTVVERAGHVLWESAALPGLRGLRILRSGWLLGTLEKGRFRPSQALALGLPEPAVAEARQRCDFTARDEAGRYAAVRYLRGETVQADERDWPAGWHLVAVDGFALGWAKGAGGWLKNEYPPGWRWEDGEEG